MATQNRKVQLASEFDATGVRKGVDQAKQSLDDLAKGAQASGAKAAKGLEGIGDGAKTAAKEVERAGGTISGSIERSTRAFDGAQRSSANYSRALRQAMRGDADAVRSYVQHLVQVERAQAAASDGAHGMAAAFSPAQIGLLGFVGAAAAVIKAMRDGGAESRAYAQALILSGSAAGATTGQLQEMAATVSRAAGTQGQAAAVIAKLAASGRVAAADIGELAEAAIRLERAGGPAADKTAEAFERLAKSPVQSVLKLNETTHFLTVEILEQVRALEEQGRVTDAAKVAQSAYADTAKSRAGELERSLGTLQRAWRGVKDAAASAWDAMLDIGREDTPQQKLTALESRLGMYQRLGSGGGLLGSWASGQAADIAAQMAQLRTQMREEAERAADKATSARLVEDYERARAANQKWADAALTNSEKLNKALTEYRRNLATINEARAREGLAPVTDAEVRAQEAAIRRSIDGTKQLSAAERERQQVLQASRDAAREWAQSITSFQSMQAQAEASADGLSTAQRKVVQMLTSPAWQQASVPMRELALQSFFAAQGAIDHAEAEKQRAQAMAETERERQRTLAGLDRGIDAQQRELRMLQDEFLELTQGKAARDAVVQKRLEDAAAMARQEANQALLMDGLTEETKRLLALADAQQQVADQRSANAAQRQVNEATEEARKAVEEARKESERWMSDMQRGLTDVFRQAFLAGGNFGKNFARGLAAEVQARLATALASVLAEAVLGAGLRTATGGSGAAMTWLQGANTASSLYGAASGYSGGVNALAGMLGAGSTAGAAAGSLAYANAVGAMGGDSLGAFIAANNSWGGVAAGSSTAAGSSSAAGASLGAYAGHAALIYAAAMHQSSLYDKGFTGDDRMSGKFLYDISPIALGVKILSALGISDKWANILSGAVAFNYLFGRAAPKITEQGITGVLSGGDFEGSAYANWKSKGGLFRSDKKGTILADLPDELARFLDDAAASVRNSVAQYGQALGLPADELDRITRQIKIALTDDAEANMQAIAKEMGSYGDALVESWAAAVAPLANYGETTAQTIARVGSAIVGVNDVLEALGKAALQASIDGGQAALTLQQYFGSLENMQQAAGSYLQNYYSDEERRSLLLGRMGGALGDVGIGDVPQTREAFRSLVDSLDLTTDSGQRAFAALMGVADAFAAVVPAAEDASAALAQAAADIARERESLQVDLWREQGNDGALREWERSQVHAENLDLYDELLALRDSKAEAARMAEAERQRQAAAESARAAWARAQEAAEQAAAAAAKAWQDAAESIRAEIDRLRGATDPSLTLGGAAREFAIATAQARAGDVSAADRLPELSRAYADAAEEMANSADDLRLMRARIAASLEETLRLRGLSSVPGFAAGGVHFGGARIVGERGPEIEITGPSRIVNLDQLLNGADQAAIVAKLQALLEANENLRGFMESALLTIARNTKQAAETLDDAARGRQPLVTTT